MLLHVTVLRRDGYQTAYEGARLVGECVQRSQGLSGVPHRLDGRVHRDPSGADAAAADPCQRHADQRVWSGRRSNGSTGLRGFGFLTCGEGTPDIFVHMETLRRFGMTELRPGQYVLVRFGPGSKGMMAAEIQPETGPPALSSH